MRCRCVSASRSRTSPCSRATSQTTPTPRYDIEQAIVLALTTALDSRVVRDVLDSYGLAVRRGEVRVFTPFVATVMPGTGFDHTVAQAADPLMM